ncbi:MAG: CapA family protein [Anaerolineales bacterium]|nr:CapA family protein [Anaerolineales bacterium]
MCSERQHIYRISPTQNNRGKEYDYWPVTESENLRNRVLAALFLVFLAGCQPRQTVTLAFLGDLMLGRGVTPDEDSLAYLAPYLQSADLALANLESPFAVNPSLNLSPSTSQPSNLPTSQPSNLPTF